MSEVFLILVVGLAVVGFSPVIISLIGMPFALVNSRAWGMTRWDSRLTWFVVAPSVLSITMMALYPQWLIAVALTDKEAMSFVLSFAGYGLLLLGLRFLFLMFKLRSSRAFLLSLGVGLVHVALYFSVITLQYATFQEGPAEQMRESIWYEMKMDKTHGAYLGVVDIN